MDERELFYLGAPKWVDCVTPLMKYKIGLLSLDVSLLIYPSYLLLGRRTCSRFFFGGLSLFAPKSVETGFLSALQSIREDTLNVYL